MATPATTTPLIQRGMNPQQAIELVSQINGTPNPADTDRLMGMGFPAPLATELAAQIDAEAGNAAKLMGLGVPPSLAEYIDAAIDAAYAA